MQRGHSDHFLLHRRKGSVKAATAASENTPYSLLPTPYSLHPTPYSLHPTPYTRLQPHRAQLALALPILYCSVKWVGGCPGSGCAPVCVATSRFRCRLPTLPTLVPNLLRSGARGGGRGQSRLGVRGLREFWGVWCTLQRTAYMRAHPSRPSRLMIRLDSRATGYSWS